VISSSRMKRLSLLAILVAAACGGPPTYDMEPAVVRFVRIAPAPPPGAYIPSAAPSARVQLCTQQGLEAKDEVKCMQATFEEAALPALRILAVQNETSMDSWGEVVVPSPFDDEVAATLAAGKVAAATSPHELLAMLGDPSLPTQGFALRALDFMLDTQKEAAGYAELAARTAAACAELLASSEARVAMTAALCITTSKDAKALPAVARAFALRTEAAFKAQTGDVVLALPKGTLDDASLHAVAEWLRTPIPKGGNPDPECEGRDVSCAVLKAMVDGEPDWAMTPARIAYENERRAGETWPGRQSAGRGCGLYSKMIAE
jgi:hypothetical protein